MRRVDAETLRVRMTIGRPHFQHHGLARHAFGFAAFGGFRKPPECFPMLSHCLNLIESGFAGNGFGSVLGMILRLSCPRASRASASPLSHSVLQFGFVDFLQLRHVPNTVARQLGLHGLTDTQMALTVM